MRKKYEHRKTIFKLMANAECTKKRKLFHQ